MKKPKIAILFGVLLVLALTASAFAELVVTYTSSDDMWNEITIEDTAELQMQQSHVVEPLRYGRRLGIKMLLKRGFCVN